MFNTIEPSKTTIHFIRHAEVYNPKNILYARIPRYRLNKVGIAQAKTVAAHLKANHNVVSVFHSPMLRARQTARYIATACDVPLKPSSFLNEIYTPYEGVSVKELDAINWDIYSNIDPEYEQPEDIMRRIKHFSLRILREFLGKEIVAVTHGDIVLHAQMWARNLDPSHQNLRSVSPYPAAVSMTSLTFTGANAQPSFAYFEPYKPDAKK